MSNFEVNQTVMDFYNLLGKQVSFVYKASSFFINTDGMVISVVLNLTGEHQFMIDSSPDFYSFSDVLEFQILDSDPVADAFEALITDNKDFIDSLSKPTL